MGEDNDKPTLFLYQLFIMLNPEKTLRAAIYAEMFTGVAIQVAV